MTPRSLEWVDAQTIKGSLSVESRQPVGMYDVLITNPGGAQGQIGFVVNDPCME